MADNDVAGYYHAGDPFRVHVADSGQDIQVRHDLSERHVDVVLAGGLINAFRRDRE